MVRPIPFGKLQKTRTVIFETMPLVYSFYSVQLIWMYFVAGPSPTSSDLWFYAYAQDFGPGDLCKWYILIPLFVHFTQGQLY